MSNMRYIFLTIVLLSYAQCFKCDVTHQPLVQQQLRTWISNTINLFYPERAPPRHQISFIVLSDQNSTNLVLSASPKDRYGKPVVKTSQPFSPENRINYVNYVTTKPEPVANNQQPILAKQLLDDELPILWKKYVDHFGTPPTLLLWYSSIILSEDLVTHVIDKVTTDTYSNLTNKIISYSNEGKNLANRNCSLNENSVSRMKDAGIIVYHQNCWNFPPCTSERIRGKISKALRKNKDSTDQCTVTETVQGCMFNCLGESFMCCSEENHASAMKANFINELFSKCRNESLENCGTTWIKGVLGNDCNCLDVSNFLTKYTQCSKQCSKFALSNPLDPAEPSSYTGILQDTNDLQNFEKSNEQCEETNMFGTFCSKKKVPIKKICTDVRMTGSDCDQRKSSYVNAKNYLCRQHHPCGYHGYRYTWCYTDYHDNWEYCCTGSCGYHGYSYRWCKAGSTWEYCID